MNVGLFTGAMTTKLGRVEQAHLGTLFLDEVGSLDLSVQSKLLQVLQDGTFVRVGGHDPRSITTRLVSASNGDLRSQVEEGTFRLDFLFRINAVTINLPPLRQRIADLPILVDYYIDHYAKAFQCTPELLSKSAIRLMQNYHWPGNIRQLENLIRSYVLIGSEEALVAELMPETPRGGITTEIDISEPVSLKRITKQATQDLERQIILKVLQANSWNRQKTAKWLQISYRSLLYKLSQQLEPPKDGQMAADQLSFAALQAQRGRYAGGSIPSYPHSAEPQKSSGAAHYSEAGLRQPYARLLGSRHGNLVRISNIDRARAGRNSHPARAALCLDRLICRSGHDSADRLEQPGISLRQRPAMIARNPLRIRMERLVQRRRPLYRIDQHLPDRRHVIYIGPPASPGLLQ